MRSWAAYGVPPLIGLASAPLLARALGPTGRGELAAILQPSTVAGAVAALGVPAAVAFYVARGGDVRSIQRKGYVVISASTLAVVAGLLWYSFVVSASVGLDQKLLFLIWLSVIPAAGLAVRRAAWQGLQQYGPIDVERSASGVLRLLFIATLFVLGVTASGSYALAYVFASLGASGVLLKPLRLSKIQPVVEPSMGDFARYAVLASIGTITLTLNNRLDQALLPATVDASALGYYSVAVTIAEIPLVISTVAARNLVAESATSDAQRMRHTVAVSLTALLAVCVLMFSVTPYALPLIFGGSFAPAVTITQGLIFVSVITAIGEGSGAYLVGRGRPGVASLAPALGATATIAMFAWNWDTMTVTQAVVIALVSQSLATCTSVAISAKISRQK